MTCYTLEERALACLRGVAVGDAMGKMTEGYWDHLTGTTPRLRARPAQVGANVSVRLGTNAIHAV